MSERAGAHVNRSRTRAARKYRARNAFNREMPEGLEFFCLDVFDNIGPRVDHFLVLFLNSRGVGGYAESFTPKRSWEL